MTEATGFPKALDDALKKYFEDGNQTEVNAYLDELGVEHPHLTTHPGQPGEFQMRIPGCPDGYEWRQSTYYNKHSGWTTTGGCVWKSGIH